MSDLAGRRIAVVGARFAAGAEVARILIAHKAAVIVDAPVPGASAVCDIDYGRMEAAESQLQALEDAAGPIGTLVLSPRPVATSNFLTVDLATMVRVLNEELIWFAMLMQAAAGRMSERGFGRIIGLCSMSGKTGVHPHVAPFAAAKGGLIALSRSLAAEVAARGVTVNMIAHALLEYQVAHHPQERQVELARNIPVGRFGKGSEVAHAVMYLASEGGGYVTGETLNLSGGRFMD